MSDRTVNILTALCLVIAVGVMSWRSMHPSSSAAHGTMTFYYAGNGITPDKIPADQNSVTVGVGSFSYPEDGKMVWTPQGMPPVTIAQRQINLQFRFDGLPHDPAATIKQVEAVIAEWQHKGDIINILIFDYSPAQPDLKTYAALINATNAYFTREYKADPYMIYPTANLHRAEQSQDAIARSFAASKTPFVISVPEAKISQKLFKQLSDFKFLFILQFPKGVASADIDLPHLLKLKKLYGIALTLDPDKPLPQDKDAVGLFPKL